MFRRDEICRGKGQEGPLLAPRAGLIVRGAFVGGGLWFRGGFQPLELPLQMIPTKRPLAEFGLQLQGDAVQPFKIVLQMGDGGFQVEQAVGCRFGLGHGLTVE